MKNLRAEARGRDCLIRIPNVCCHDPETTVGCHLRMPGLSGFGIKSSDHFIAWGCHKCHAYVDTHHDDATKVAFYEAIFRTQAQLIRESKLHE